MQTMDSDDDNAEPTEFDREEWFSSECSEASTSDGESDEKKTHIALCVSLCGWWV
jgi:hypothetical protein